MDVHRQKNAELQPQGTGPCPVRGLGSRREEEGEVDTHKGNGRGGTGDDSTHTENGRDKKKRKFKRACLTAVHGCVGCTWVIQTRRIAYAREWVRRATTVPAKYFIWLSLSPPGCLQRFQKTNKNQSHPDYTATTMKHATRTAIKARTRTSHDTAELHRKEGICCPRCAGGRKNFAPRSCKGACGRGRSPPSPCHTAVTRTPSRGSCKVSTERNQGGGVL